MPEHKLTWHVGSVLPYASLWHTVLRACALNALRASDLPRSNGRRSSAIELITDDTHRVNIAAFAHELGESPDAFQWPTLGALPFWLRRAVAAPHPRICLACLSAGYHTALFSIKLLDTCPIHGTPLSSCCHCGAPFDATLRRAADYGTAGSCRCGRLHFFTRETCRRPQLPIEATDALAPVANWLESCCTLIRSRLLDDALMQQAAGSVRWLALSANALGILWPSCFRPLRPARLPLQTVLHRRQRGRGVTAAGIVSPHAARPPEVSTFWHDTAELTVYRAIARHVRRHIAPHSANIIRSFIETGDPLEIGRQIQSNDRALRAFTDVLWSRAIEPAVEQRRWPDRRQPLGVVGGVRTSINEACQVSAQKSLTQEQARWLEYHATRVTLDAVWHEATLRAALIARTGVAEWSDTDSYVMWDRCAWLARVTPDALRLVAAPPEVWETAPRSPKPERCSAYLQALEHRRDVALAGCPCLCLTWLGDAGWTVRAVYKPADLDLRRRRVLGFKNKRLWCWIYRTDDKVFAARLAGARLQTTGTTPGAAITALRRSAAVYQRICNVDLPHTRPSLLIHPEPMDPMLANRYRELVADVQHFGGFWRAGPELADSARRYQRARIRGAWRA